MSRPTTKTVQQWAAEAGFPPHIRAAGAGRELDRFAALAFAAGQAAEREAIIARLLELGVLGDDGEFIAAICARSLTAKEAEDAHDAP